VTVFLCRRRRVCER